MTTQNQTYKCLKCGNIVEVLTTGAGSLTCCDTPMKTLNENTQEAATEKHIPVVTRENNGLKVKIGEVEHPMGDDHWIEWVEVVTETQVYRHNFLPTDQPECFFPIEPTTFKVRAYCNLHGLWKSEELS